MQTAPADRVYDIAIVGGGINGCGIARDAAGRGWSVYLCERSDLASGTSSASTKLIHGGLRYLEHYEFRLVREALLEREVLWAIAPHIIRPLRFVLPYHRGLRPSWLLRSGLFLYDHLGGRRLLPPTRTLDLSANEFGKPLQPGLFSTGYEYSDCWVDDARLVVLNARAAAALGAQIATRTDLISAVRNNGTWHATVRNRRSGVESQIQARVLVNAAGPWVQNVLTKSSGPIAGPKRTRLVQGSHIVVPKLFDHANAYIFQNADGRIVFAIPYEQDFTLIGTTDVEFIGDPAECAISDAEIEYLCRAASEYFSKPVRTTDIVWTYAGVRPLYDDGTQAAQAATRDYVLDLQAPEGQPPMLSIFGGKITTYRRLAEAVLEKIQPYVPTPPLRAKGWTGREPLPGGNFATDAIGKITAGLRRDFPFLTEHHAKRLTSAYGLDARVLLGTARSQDDLGRDFGATLTEAEIAYLRREEWAEQAEDVLWRRSKLGLKMTADQRRTVAEYLAS